MKRSNDRILTTHVGSLPRPQALLDMANVFSGPPEDRDAYEKLLAEAVKVVVGDQARAGIDVINDGELGRESWATYIHNRVTGFEERPDAPRELEWLGRDRERFPVSVEEQFSNGLGTTEACVGPIAYRDKWKIDRDIDNLNAALKGVQVEEAFVTAVAPASCTFNTVNEYYPNDEEFIFAFAEALRVEYLAIHASGRLIQVDDAVLANMYDCLVQKDPDSYNKWAQLRIDALNHALRGIPEDRVRYHLCFGSWHLPHTSDAPLEEIIGFITQVKAGAYSIEAANPRHEHEWRVWETVKLGDKILIPGVITHHTVTVEHPRLIADRLVRFAKIVGRENVIAGADCGFAQADVICRVFPEVMWAKFDALVEGARIASEELWGRKAAA